MDSAIAEFCAFTSAEPDTAAQYLEAADGNLQQAVELFFASDGVTGAAQSAAMSGGGNHGDSGEVRDRIAGGIDQIVDDEAQMSYEMMRESRRAMWAARRPHGVFSQSRDTDPSALGERSERRLAELFRPPFDLIRDLGLEEAREDAQQEGKWVMVNVQDPQEFVCQRLNRDLWKDNEVKDEVERHFLFLQYESDSPDGDDYRNLYPFEDFPHISVLDPWTGEQMRTWNYFVDPEDFVEQLIEFIGENGHPHVASDDSGPAVPAAEVEGSASIRETEGSTEAPEATASDCEALVETDPTASIEARAIPEPPAGPDVTRIQLRFGDGRRLVRRFRIEDPVTDIYAVVKSIAPELEGKAVNLTAERRDLVDDIGKTVGEANLKNSTVLVEEK